MNNLTRNLMRKCADLRRCVERISAERDTMIRANVELQERLSALIASTVGTPDEAERVSTFAARYGMTIGDALTEALQ